jgi:hypothetical protein
LAVLSRPQSRIEARLAPGSPITRCRGHLPRSSSPALVVTRTFLGTPLFLPENPSRSYRLS